jgi:hypothetical protein
VAADGQEALERLTALNADVIRRGSDHAPHGRFRTATELEGTR